MRVYPPTPPIVRVCKKSGTDTDGEYDPVQEVDRIMKTLRTCIIEPLEEMLGAAPTKEETPPSTGPEIVATHTKAKPLRVVSVKEPIRFAGLEVGITSTKAKRVHYSEDSDCGLFSDGSDEMEDEYNSHEEESEEETHEVIPELVTDPLSDN